MKKSYFIIIAVVALFITTGCLSSGNKRLVCKQNASGVDVTFNIANAFIGCNQDIENKHLVVKAELDVDKLAGNAISKKTSPSAAKKELEKQQYTCSYN